MPLALPVVVDSIKFNATSEKGRDKNEPLENQAWKMESYHYWIRGM